MLIEAIGLRKEYILEKVVTKVLNGLDFRIERGEFVAIIGPSGSGKSTLMHILGFLERPTSGLYNFNGRDTRSLSDKELALFRNEKVGFVFQSFNLLPRTTVMENVRLPRLYARAREDSDVRTEEAVRQVGLSHRRHYFSNQLSGGEKQRVAIARALVNRPEIIFADEPTGNLDSAAGAQIMELLQDLHQAGHTVVLVTHETFTSEHAQRIIKLKDGLIISDQPVAKRRFARDGSFIK